MARGEKAMGLDLKKIFPGESVRLQLSPGEQLDVTVYPIGVRHIRKFAQGITYVAKQLDGLNAAGAGGLIKFLLPVVLNDLLGLVNETTKGIDLEDEHCPHWIAAPVVEAWLLANFGQPEMVEPWRTALDTISEKLTGEKMDWSGLSERLSETATPSTASSTPSSPSSPTGDTPGSNASPSTETPSATEPAEQPKQ